MKSQSSGWSSALIIPDEDTIRRVFKTASVISFTIYNLMQLSVHHCSFTTVMYGWLIMNQLNFIRTNAHVTTIHTMYFSLIYLYLYFSILSRVQFWIIYVASAVVLCLSCKQIDTSYFPRPLDLTLLSLYFTLKHFRIILNLFEQFVW